MLLYMPRMPRFFLQNVPQHVVQRGNDRRPLFLDDEDAARFAGLLAHAARRYEAAIHAYVLMTNHVHLLATPSRPMSLPRTMQWTFSRYVEYFNARYGRSGALLERRYRAAVVEDDRYLFACMRYIELNPVRAGMVVGPAEHRWSSFRANAKGAQDELLTPHPAYLALGDDPRERRDAYLDLFRSLIPEADIELIRDATQHGWAIGGALFRSLVAASGRRADRASAGRRPRAPISGRGRGSERLR